MEQYKKNTSGAKGVEFYEIKDESLITQFVDGSIYQYTYESAGTEIIEQMKQLALAGEGLTTFINQHVKDKYAKKLK